MGGKREKTGGRKGRKRGFRGLVKGISPQGGIVKYLAILETKTIDCQRKAGGGGEKKKKRKRFNGASPYIDALRRVFAHPFNLLSGKKKLSLGDGEEAVRKEGTLSQEGPGLKGAA